MKRTETRRARRAVRVRTPEPSAEQALDAVRGRSEDSRPLTGTLGGTEPGFGLIVNREALRPLLRALPERERRILCMRFFCYTQFFCAMTQNRIGPQLSLWQMQVSRLIVRTCARLRDRLMAEACG
ncbi:DNA-directed RNA polymerase specialized sigma subunit [Streptomyces sp. SAI-144]|nr:DNA-directed RNA polymerase specialized sigma subunit [Streptomyces sp. SAI-144]